MKAANDNVNLIDLREDMKQFLAVLENELGRELIITSGYRSLDHPIEKKKKKQGPHTFGLAVDVVAIGGDEVFEIVKIAMDLGCKRFGISRKNNFIHMDLCNEEHGKVPRAIWTY
ncbi:MAG: D-Ala-D-Ala carboxypeptidase family metallohydrolase [Pirellulales bacterium]|nr:D-Ala-D-Ala carboxypeptidase family metallohydrolase [Pirellulales bacterium]